MFSFLCFSNFSKMIFWVSEQIKLFRCYKKRNASTNLYYKILIVRKRVLEEIIF